MNLLLLAFLLYGCSTTDPGPSVRRQNWDAVTHWVDAQELRSLPCKQPKNATASNGFKHGCFCGSGHPIIDTGGLSEEKALKKFIVSAGAIRPYDAIDRICKIHDICLAKHNFDPFCDPLSSIDFANLDRKYTAMLDNIPISQTTKREKIQRCRALSAVITESVGTIFAPSRPKGGLAHKAGEASIDVFKTGLSAILAPFVIGAALLDPETFPKKGERCE